MHAVAMTLSGHKVTRHIKKSCYCCKNGDNTTDTENVLIIFFLFHFSFLHLCSKAPKRRKIIPLS